MSHSALDICFHLFYSFFPFFFYSSRSHRDLHSFPTRRSSDLTTVFLDLSLNGQVLAFTIGAAVATVILFRSEEHTSELQSLTNLVCRLLLEKKKKNKRQHNIY